MLRQLDQSCPRDNNNERTVAYCGKKAATPSPTMNRSPASSTTHEYRMKVSRSGLYLLSAALLILTSIPLARGQVGMGTPMAFGRIVIGGLLLLCGLFMVATVLRSRLAIEESQIRFRIVFREEVFPLSEIEGLRTISTGPASNRVARRVICVRGRSEPIEIVQFEHDDFLKTWLQRMPNLDEPTGDQPDQTGSLNIKSGVILVFSCLAAFVGCLVAIVTIRALALRRITNVWMLVGELLLAALAAYLIYVGQRGMGYARGRPQRKTRFGWGRIIVGALLLFSSANAHFHLIRSTRAVIRPLAPSNAAHAALNVPAFAIAIGCIILIFSGFWSGFRRKALKP